MKPVKYWLAGIAAALLFTSITAATRATDEIETASAANYEQLTPPLEN